MWVILILFDHLAFLNLENRVKKKILLNLGDDLIFLPYNPSIYMYI